MLLGGTTIESWVLFQKGNSFKRRDSLCTECWASVIETYFVHCSRIKQGSSGTLKTRQNIYNSELTSSGTLINLSGLFIHTARRGAFITKRSWLKRRYFQKISSFSPLWFFPHTQTGEMFWKKTAGERAEVS